MARIVKRKRRRLNMLGLSVAFFTLSLAIWLIATLLVNTLNTSLTMKIQKMSDEIEVLRNENQNLSYTIQTLENKDRIYEVAEANNLSQITDNIISVSGE